MKKFSTFLPKARKQDGIIIMIVLWVLVILTALAVSLGRNTGLELALVRNHMAKMKARYIAWAGFMHAVDLVERDSEAEEFQDKDTLLYCGTPKLDDKNLAELFESQPVGEGSFTISYVLGKDSPAVLGLQDEERRININALNQQNVGAVSSLLELLGYDAEAAQTISYAIVDWKDADNNVVYQSYGAEDDYYQGLSSPYHCKNRPFDSIEELLLVRGVTQEIFDDVKDYLTIYPKEGFFKINFETASETVLKALARSVTGPSTNTSQGDADSLVAKIVSYRAGSDGREMTEDDQVLNMPDMALSASETALFLVLNQFKTDRSEYLRVSVQAVENNRRAKASLEAIVAKQSLTPVSWRRF